MTEPIEATQIESETHSGVLRQVANAIDEAEVEPSAVLVLACYHDGGHIVAHAVDDDGLAALSDGVDTLLERIADIAIEMGS